MAPEEPPGEPRAEEKPPGEPRPAEEPPSEPPAAEEPSESAAPAAPEEAPSGMAAVDTVGDVGAGVTTQSYLQAARLAQDRISQVNAAIEELKAENEAYRASVETDLARKFDSGRERLLLSSVQTLESLDEAVQAARAGGASDALLEGIMLVRTQLYRLLGEEGLQRISVLGLPFDARTSQVSGQTPVDEESQHGLVVQEVTSGQQLDGRVVRRARVMVGEYTTEPLVKEAPEEAEARAAAEGDQPTALMPAIDEHEFPTLIGTPAFIHGEPTALIPIPPAPRPADEGSPDTTPPDTTMVQEAPFAAPEGATMITGPGLPEVDAESEQADPSATMPFMRVNEKPAETPPEPVPVPEPATMISMIDEPAPEPEPPEATAVLPVVAAPSNPPSVPPDPVALREPRPAPPAPAPPPPPPRPTPAPPVAAPPPVYEAPRAPTDVKGPAAPRPRRGLFIASIAGVALLLAVLLVELRLLFRPSPQPSPTAAEGPAPAPAASVPTAAASPLVAEAPPLTAAPPPTVALPPVTTAPLPATMAPPTTVVARPVAPPALPTPAAATPRPVPSPRTAAPTPEPAPVAPPNPAVALLAQADRAAAAQRFDEAIRLYDQALQVDPKNSDAAAGRLRVMIARDARRTFSAGPTRAETPGSGKGLSGFEDVRVTKAPKHSGKIEFEVAPRIPLPGEPYTVDVHLTNTGNKGFKIASLTVVTTVNGSAATETPAPLTREVGEGRRALLVELPGIWRVGTTSWSMSVTVTAPGGEAFRSQLTWR